MNYIWDLAIKAISEDMDPDMIFYRYGRPLSPYMELNFPDMNEKEVQPEVEINPFYRYYHIFKELFAPDVVENEEVIEVLHDLTVHHLQNIDVLMGMNKREYQIHFVIRDMYSGYFGKYIKENVHVLTRAEQKIVANNLLTLHTTAECIHLLKETIRQIFVHAYIFSNAQEKDEIVFFLRTNETKEKMAKIEIIKYLFLPFKCNILVYWDHIFAVLGVPELTRMGESMNY
jgi:hypothetical protein